MHSIVHPEVSCQKSKLRWVHRHPAALISLQQTFLFLKLKARKPQMGSRDVLYSFFNLGTKWGWVVNTIPWVTLLPGKRPGTHFTEGWVCPRASLVGCGKSCFLLGFNPWTFQPVLSCYISAHPETGK
jgi:hypothetical protein